MSKRYPCDEKKPLKRPKASALDADAKPPWVEIDGAAADPESGAGDSPAFSGPVAPSSVVSGSEDLSAPDPSPALPPGHFIGLDGRLYRRVHIRRGSGWIDYSELAD